MLSMTDTPYLFDFGRNRIHLMDIPGYVSPDGNMPFGKGAGRLREYLLSHDIRFLAFTPPDQALLQFRRDYWQHPVRGRESFYDRIYAPPMLDTMDSVEALDREYRAVFEAKQLRVLDVFPSVRGAGGVIDALPGADLPEDLAHPTRAAVP